MTAPDAGQIARTAARAALRVPGVTGLDPDLRQSLSRAAAWVRDPGGAHDTRPGDGVRARRAAPGAPWHVELRCLLRPDHRCLDTAREVRSAVTLAVGELLAAAGPAAAERETSATTGPAAGVTVGVTVTRLT